MYRVLPDIRIPWRDVWFGAAVSSALFLVGRWAISTYIASAKLVSTFGAASALVVILVWVYYSAQIFLLGAEFTWVYAHSHGSRKDENAKPVPAPAPPPRLAHDPLPAHKRHPVASFGLAAAFGAIAGLLSRFKLR
jgi:membrane protein